MSDIRCVWHSRPRKRPTSERPDTEWLTGCGRVIHRKGRGFVYCPFCGRMIRSAI